MSRSRKHLFTAYKGYSSNGKDAKLRDLQCKCGSGAIAYWLYDARGIEIGKGCDHCAETIRAKFRPDVLTNPDYWHDEEL